MITTVKIDEIRVCERVRKDMGDMDSLIASIKDLGLLQPIALRRGSGSGPILVAGARRVEACRRLGWRWIPVRFITTISDAVQYLKAERDENTQRKDFAPSEAVAMGEKLEALERPEAEARLHQAKGRGKKNVNNKRCGKLPQVKKTRDKVGAAVGMSGKTYEKAKAVKAAAESNPELFGDLLAKMDAHSVDAAFREMKERKREKKRQDNAVKVAGAKSVEELSGLFSTITIDPPWDWGDEDDVNQLGRAKPDYATIPYDKLLAFPVASKADTDAHIYLWITNRSLPKGFALLEAWGFRYVTCLTWCKPSFGMGNYFRGQTEHVLFGVRGSLKLKRADVGTCFTAKRGDGHSAKPHEFYALVESCSHGPYLEVFSRSGRAGWTHWGENS